MGVSKNDGTPKSSILIGFFIINHPFWGTVPLFLETPIYAPIYDRSVYITYQLLTDEVSIKRYQKYVLEPDPTGYHKRMIGTQIQTTDALSSDS